MLRQLLAWLGRTVQRQRVGVGATGVQIVGDDNTVIIAGEARLVLERRHVRKATPNSVRDLIEFRATDFVGREEELGALRNWMTTRREGRDILVHCVTGQGGAGKTRLAVELCEWAEAEGWAAGFVHSEELARFHEHHHAGEWRWPKKTLAVVDYAAASGRVLRSFLGEMARGAPASHEAPLRILLLERHADRSTGWWADLIRPGGLSGLGPDSLIYSTVPQPLWPLRASDERRALLVQAIALAAPILKRSPPSLPPVGADENFDRKLADNSIETGPLFLIMAGIVAVESGAPTALSLGRLDLAERVADAESDRLRRLAIAAGADETLVLHLAACSTLQGGCNGEEAFALVQEERGALGDRSNKRTDQLAILLNDALPTLNGNGIDAVRPDLIGEAFLLKELRPAQQVESVQRAFQRTRQRVIGTVIRLAQDCASDFYDTPLVWFDHIGSLLEDDPLSLSEFAEAIPAKSLILAGRELGFRKRIVIELTRRAENDATVRPELASNLQRLGSTLVDAGRDQEGLEAAEKSVALLRPLARMEADQFRLRLAVSLLSLAQIQERMTRLQEAFVTATEAYNIFLEPQHSASSRDFRVAQAQLLRGDLLEGLGKLQEAYDVSKDAVDRFRLLSKKDTNFLDYLGGALLNLANRLTELKRINEAIPLLEESENIFAVLAAQRADTYLGDLNLVRRQHARALSRNGNPCLAIRVITDAVETYRVLARQYPSRFSSLLGSTLNNYGNMLGNAGREQQAIAALEESVSVWRGISSRVARRETAISLMALAMWLDKTEDYRGALAANHEALQVIQEGLAQFPEDLSDFALQVMTDYLKRCKGTQTAVDRSLVDSIQNVLIATKRIVTFTVHPGTSQMT